MQHFWDLLDLAWGAAAQGPGGPAAVAVNDDEDDQSSAGVLVNEADESQQVVDMDESQVNQESQDVEVTDFQIYDPAPESTQVSETFETAPPAPCATGSSADTTEPSTIDKSHKFGESKSEKLAKLDALRYTVKKMQFRCLEIILQGTPCFTSWGDLGVCILQVADPKAEGQPH